MKKNSEKKYEFEVPTSIREARTRLNAITVDLMNVEKQLGDRRRTKTMAETDYHLWREKTKAARIFLVAEHRQIKAWIFDRRRRLLAKDSDIWPEADPRTMLQRVLLEGRKYLHDKENSFVEVLDSVELYLTHDA